MRIYIIEKQKGRIYKSADIVKSLTGQELSHDEKGAPKAEGLYISLSDTKKHWALAVSLDGPIGLDIEEGGRLVKASAANRLHKREREYLAALQPESSEWREEFLSIWTRKEAFMKLQGEGLRMGLSSFSVIDDNATLSFKRKGLIIGIAGDFLEYEIEDASFAAPFEKSCLDAAAELLSLRMHGAEELRKKLAGKGYPEDDIAKAFEKLREYNYLNDEEYARLRAERLAASGMAPRRIKAELQRRGLASEIASLAADSYREGQRAAALEIAEKLAAKASIPKGEERFFATQKLKARVARKLSSLGYESSIIYDILEKLRL